ncbi:YoaK family protein [Herminiimonas sp. NPDC097707]|uniref:YoaK family protein n=1 Tax=Herminiimonas sp. NPDC097707 TaxID=3364007 RepID=UPI00383A08EA
MQWLLRQLKFDKNTNSVLTLNVTLGFLAGYVDALGFMALFGLFTAHITGNLVLLGAELATPGHTFPILKILVFPAFIVGVALAKIIASRCQKNARNALVFLYVLEMVLLIAFMLAGMSAHPLDEENISSLAMLTGMVAAMAMGVHSACGRILLTDLTPTGMMTGNVTQLIIELVELIVEGGDNRTRRNFAKYFWPIIAFGLGALLAAFAYARLGFQALLLPIAMILILACVEKWGKAGP